MTLGIRRVVGAIPEARVETAPRAGILGISKEELQNGIGVSHLSQRRPGQDASDLCIAAAEKLFEVEWLEPAQIECMTVVTQSPDAYGIPHVAAILHRKLGLPERCASFDISLGGSGYVYGLSILRALMESNGWRCGLLFTADPCSRIVDESDPETALRFGDAATVTLLTDQPSWTIGRFDLGTAGIMGRALEVRMERGGQLHMNTGAIYSFALERVPRSISRVLESNELTLGEVDRVVVQQVGKGIVDDIGQKMGIPGKLGFHATDYGDTGSSSIPLVLEQNLGPSDRRVVISGFGAGLSWATTVLTKVN